MNIDVNGTLWVDVEEVDKVNRVVVTEPKSKFCKVFYTDPIPETRFTPSEEYVKPKASAQPMRKKGKWIYNSPVTMKCDQCEYVVRDWFVKQFRYCPSCGADMRGDPNE